MKAKLYIMANNDVKRTVLDHIANVECDGNIQIAISNVGTKSRRQQGLDYAWDSDILKSSIGWADNCIETVHARGKWMFARPILIRDDDLFRMIYSYFIDKHRHDKEKYLRFARDYISTQSMSVSQVAEYMENKQRFWLDKGVNLTNPDLYNLKIQ